MDSKQKVYVVFSESLNNNYTTIEGVFLGFEDAFEYLEMLQTSRDGDDNIYLQRSELTEVCDGH